MLGFVPVNVIHLKKDVWFCVLDDKQISSVDEYLEGKTN